MTPATTTTTNQPLFEKMADTSAEQVRDLIARHWPAIEAIALAAGKSKAAVAVSLKFERVSDGTTKVTSSLRYAEKHSDEREDYVETDANQRKLGLGEDKA